MHWFPSVGIANFRIWLQAEVPKRGDLRPELALKPMLAHRRWP